MTGLRTFAGLVLATALAMSSGCAKTDWIDRTLVTVDVTGTWSGSITGPGGSRVYVFELEQQGSTVTGAMRMSGAELSLE